MRPDPLLSTPEHMMYSGAQRPSAGRTHRSVDIYAAGIAFLCLVHCLVLPVLLSSASLALPFVENEWVHRVLVLFAAPATLYVIGLDWKRPGRHWFVAVAMTGLVLLFLGAFVEPLEAYEEPITVAGSIVLAGAHLWHAFRRRVPRAVETTSTS